MNRLVLDIETAPDMDADMEDYRDRVKAPAQYKKPESIDKWIDENADRVAHEEWRKTALDGTYGKIIAIGVGVPGDEWPDVFVGDDEEKLLLQKLFEVCYEFTEAKPGQGDFTPIQFIGHNILDFDLPFLWKRCVVNGMKPPYALKKAMKERYSGKAVYDTMREWAGWKGYISQDALADALGIEKRRTPIADGSEVFGYYVDHAWEAISDYCSADVQLCGEIWRRMNFQ